MDVEEFEEQKDSFTIGTAATGGCFKVYFNILETADAVRKVDEAIRLWKNSVLLSGKSK